MWPTRRWSENQQSENPMQHIIMIMLDKSMLYESKSTSNSMKVCKGLRQVCSHHQGLRLVPHKIFAFQCCVPSNQLGKPKCQMKVGNERDIFFQFWKQSKQVNIPLLFLPSSSGIKDLLSAWNISHNSLQLHLAWAVSALWQTTKLQITGS